MRHELNTPLNHVIGYGELLLEKETTPAFVGQLEQMLDHARTIFPRMRGQELAYVNALADVTAAAVAMEMDVFEPSSLDAVAACPDALGHLARVFQRMAREIQARQERLRERGSGTPI